MIAKCTQALLKLYVTKNKQAGEIVLPLFESQGPLPLIDALNDEFMKVQDLTPEQL